MASFSGSLAKAMLCTLNLAFMLFALAIILLGLQLQVQTSFPEQEQVLIGGYRATSTLLILFASMLLLVSIFGFGAAVCESALLLNFYVYFLSVCTVTSILVTGLFIVFNDQLMTFCRHRYIQTMKQIQISTNSVDANVRAYAIQNFQHTFYCCGVDSPKDWFNRTFGNQSLKYEALPVSCCGGPIANLEPYKTCPVSQLIYHDGCFSSTQIHRYKIFGQMIAAIIILLLTLLLSLACCLERDRSLRFSQLVNLQYAAHLSNCRQQPLSGIGYFDGAGNSLNSKKQKVQKPLPVTYAPNKMIHPGTLQNVI